MLLLKIFGIFEFTSKHTKKKNLAQTPMHSSHQTPHIIVAHFYVLLYLIFHIRMFENKLIYFVYKLRVFLLNFA
jgi:hypothetical protein